MKKNPKIVIFAAKDLFKPFLKIFPYRKVPNVIGNVASKVRKPNGIVVAFLTRDFFPKNE